MPTVLSTKKLTLNQKELLLNSGIGLVEYNAITIKFIDFNLKNSGIENAVFTSKNALKALDGIDLKIDSCYCVGDKTAAHATEMGLRIFEKADNAEALALKILRDHSQKEFYFFSGNKRRDELPVLLEKNNIKVKELKVYNTNLNLKEFKSEFDGIMFFSPSGVESYTSKNLLKTTAFCIGETTASEVKKYTDNIIVATKPSVENVIAKVVSNLKNK
ncbi:MAG: uroporphyrinogen-III synthase [Gramella sp.]|nr:uroporphyrinogen-III synthase [Christiangramia sp.]